MSADDPKPITFPLYVDRWLGGTMHLSAAARGIYFDLLCWCWAHNKPLPNSKTARARIARVTQREFDKRWHEIADKWSKSGQGLVSKPLQKVREKWTDFHASQREKAKKGAAKRWEGHRKSDAPANAPGNAPSNAFGFRSSDLDHLATNLDPDSEKNPASVKKDHAPRMRSLKSVSENSRLILKWAHEVARARPDDSLGDWKDAVLKLCGEHGVEPNYAHVNDAITQADAMLRRKAAIR